MSVFSLDTLYKKSRLHRKCIDAAGFIMEGCKNYLYSCQLLIWISSCFIWQNASMKAFARRALVINGILWSMAPRRMR